MWHISLKVVHMPQTLLFSFHWGHFSGEYILNLESITSLTNLYSPIKRWRILVQQTGSKRRQVSYSCRAMILFLTLSSGQKQGVSFGSCRFFRTRAHLSVHAVKHRALLSWHILLTSYFAYHFLLCDWQAVLQKKETLLFKRSPVRMLIRQNTTLSFSLLTLQQHSLNHLSSVGPLLANGLPVVMRSLWWVTAAFI